MKDPLQIDITPYEILEVDQYADNQTIKKAWMGKLNTKQSTKATQAYKTLNKPFKRAYIDIFMFSQDYLKNILPKIREPKHLTGKRADVALMWNKLEVGEFPSIKATHSLAVLWYWWARYITESERIQKTDTISTIHSVQDLATEYSLSQLWENTISRWVMLLNSEEFMTSFEFTKDLSDEDKDQLKKEIYQHFAGLLTEYSYNYKKAGLQKESDDFRNFSLMLKSEYEAAQLLAKTKGILPKGYSCGRIFLNNIDLRKKALDTLYKDKQSLTEDELKQLTLMLSDDFYEVPILFSEKQYSECDRIIKNVLKAKGIGSSPEKVLKYAESLPEDEKREFDVVIEYFAKTCFHLGIEYSNAGDVDETCSKFEMAKKLHSSGIKPDDISDALISFLEAKAGHNADLGLFYIDKILKLFNYNKLHDFKAEIIKDKSAGLSQKIIAKINSMKSPTREQLIKITESYREVISLDKQAVAAAKSKDAVQAAKTKLINDLLDTHLMMTNAIVSNVVIQLNEVIEGVKKQIGYSMSVSTAISRMMNTPTIVDALKSAKIYYDSDKLIFLHALYEMRYCTALLGKYAFNKDDIAIIGGINAMRQLGLNQIGGKDISNILNSKKLYKYNDESYWIKSTENFLMFTNISSSSLRYTIYETYRDGDYEGALAKHKRSFNSTYGINKLENQFYKEARDNAEVSEQCERVKFIEQSAYQTNAGISVAVDAVEQYKKIPSKSATGVLADTCTESRRKLASIIENLLKKELTVKDLTKPQLSAVVDLIQKIQKEKIQIDGLNEIEKECASKLFNILVSSTEKKMAKIQAKLNKYLESPSQKADVAVINYIDEIQADYIEINDLVKKYDFDEKILLRNQAFEQQISELAEKYYDTYAKRCYSIVEKIILKSEISSKEIETIDKESRECKQVLDDYCAKSSIKKSSQLVAVSRNFEQIIKYKEFEYYNQSIETRKKYNDAVNVYLSKKYNEAADKFKEILVVAKGAKFEGLIKQYISDCFIRIYTDEIEKTEKVLYEAITKASSLPEPDYEKITQAANVFKNEMNVVAKLGREAEENSDGKKETTNKIENCKKTIRDLNAKYHDSVLVLSQRAEFDIYTKLNAAINEGNYAAGLRDYDQYEGAGQKNYPYINRMYTQLLAKIMDEDVKALKATDEKFKAKREAYVEEHKSYPLDRIKLAMKLYSSTTGCGCLAVVTIALCIILGASVSWGLGIVLLIALTIVEVMVLSTKCGYKGCKNKVDYKPANLYKLTYKKNGQPKELGVYLCPEHMKKIRNYKSDMPMPVEIKSLQDRIVNYADKALKIDKSFNKNKYMSVINEIAAKYRKA